MVKNEALNEYIDLDCRWEALVDDLYEEEFDYDFFKSLAAHTFTFLFPYREAENLPREMMSILFRIQEFASHPVSVSPESDAAKLVAYEFCNQIKDCWVQIDGGFDENSFAVFAYGEEHIIDADTFDLSGLI